MDLFQSTAFDSQVRNLMARHRVPGLAIAMVQGEKTLSTGYGHSRLEPPVPCTATTLFDIASCSKSFTAAAIGLLVEDNERHPDLQYETTMSSLLPDDFVMPGSAY